MTAPSAKGERVPFLLTYGADDIDELRRSKPRENPNALCRCGEKYSQFIVNPKYLASLTDGQRHAFVQSCERVKNVWGWPAQCARCDRKLLSNARTR